MTDPGHRKKSGLNMRKTHIYHFAPHQANNHLGEKLIRGNIIVVSFLRGAQWILGRFKNTFPIKS